MKTKILTIVIVLSLIIALVLTKLNLTSNFVDIEVENKYYLNYFPETANPETYKYFVKLENDKKLTFPRTVPDKVILYSNYNFWKNEYLLKEDEKIKLLKILNDSTKYEWGEIGTPEVHYYFKYFDREGNLIGITKIDQEAMAYSEPYLRKMKWCGIRNINEINKLIKTIEK